MNDDEYIFFDMYGLPAEYDELLALLPEWWLAACELDDRSDDCEVAPRLDAAAAAVSVSIGCTEPAHRDTTTILN